MDNPTRLLLEKTVFALECSGLLPEDASAPTSLAFSSGMQAVTSILLAHSTSGKGATTTVLIPTDVYHGVRSLLSDVFSRHGVEVRELNMVNDNNDETSGGAEAVANAIRDVAANTANERSEVNKNNRSSIIVWMETPSNPKCQVVDIKAICDAARSEQDRFHEILDVTTVVDGTMASPVLTRPLEVRRLPSIAPLFYHREFMELRFFFYLNLNHSNANFFELFLVYFLFCFVLSCPICYEKNDSMR